VIRRLARRILGPLVRWAAEGWIPNYYTIRGPGGAYLTMVGPFGEVYQKRIGVFEAVSLTDDLLDDAYRAAEDFPLPPDDSFGGK
jgi:hypothetical protein